MTEDELDEATVEKMRCAADEIKDMARARPENAPALLEQARHLIELAEQIRNDWLRRQGAKLPSMVLGAGYEDRAAARSLEREESGVDEFRLCADSSRP